MSDDLNFDFSKWDFPKERIWLHIPEGEIILKVCTFIPLILFGLFGNFIILRLIVLNRGLRTPTNMFVANMAVADLLTLIICPTMFMINDFYQNYQLGFLGCKLEGFLEAAFLIAAVLNLSTVSYDRLTAIVLPTETRLTIRGAKIVIALTWLAGFLLAMPLAIYRNYRVRQWKNFKEMYCKENTDILPKYWYLLITVMVWLPLGIMLICYTAIFYKLGRYEKRVLKREHPLAVSYKKTVAKTLFIVVIVFVALRLPFTMLVILRDKIVSSSDDTVGRSFRILWYTSQYLMFLNAAVNPLIYGFNNDNFRRAYDQTPLYRRCRRDNRVNQQQQQLQHQAKQHQCTVSATNQPVSSPCGPFDAVLMPSSSLSSSSSVSASLSCRSCCCRCLPNRKQLTIDAADADQHVTAPNSSRTTKIAQTQRSEAGTNNGTQASDTKNSYPFGATETPTSVDAGFI